MPANPNNEPSIAEVNLIFDPERYEDMTIDAGDETVAVRAWENVVYVSRPVDIEHQFMNIYIPQAYFEGGSIGGFTARTAPIFFPNAISQYLPAIPLLPRISKRTGAPNASLVALTKGYVVVSPALRGWSSQSGGKFTGKAPACIVDMKAAIRYLRYNDERMPGDTDKIIPNGFSAGGAVSALLAATGNNDDYAPYLAEAGAADARDDVFAASCYCPVYNLEHLDPGYEWQSRGITKYGFRDQPKKDLTPEQVRIAEEIGALFPPYINNLGLKSFDHVKSAGSRLPKVAAQLEEGVPLMLDAEGNGTYKEFGLSFLIAAAQRALDEGADLSAFGWLSIDAEGLVTGCDLDLYKKGLSRFRPAPVFDDPARTSAECELFGTEDVHSRHYTPQGMKYGDPGGSMAEGAPLKLMNPMNYLGLPGSTAAKYWRVRHGTLDFGHLLTNPVILSATLQNRGFDVDSAFAWGQGHGGDYDMDELFTWLGRICGA